MGPVQIGLERGRNAGGNLVEEHEDLESLWSAAEVYGVPELEKTLGARGHRASLHLSGGDVVRSGKDMNPRLALRQVIRKARALHDA